MTDTTVSTEKPPPNDPRPPCEVCGSVDHTKGFHDSETPTGFHDSSTPTGFHDSSTPTGFHDSSAPMGFHDSSVPVETGGTTK